MAGFEVIIYGRFWVIAEAAIWAFQEIYPDPCPRRFSLDLSYLGGPDLILGDPALTDTRKGPW